MEQDVEDEDEDQDLDYFSSTTQMAEKGGAKKLPGETGPEPGKEEPHLPLGQVDDDEASSFDASSTKTQAGDLLSPR